MVYILNEAQAMLDNTLAWGISQTMTGRMITSLLLARGF